MGPDLDKNQHSVYKLTYHLVLVIKYRRQVITPEIFDRLIEIFNKNAFNFGITLEESNFESDHIHFLFKTKPQTQLLKFINAYKSASSRLIKKEYPEIREKLWREAFWKIGYFISTTGGANLETVTKYIQNQKRL